VLDNSKLLILNVGSSYRIYSDGSTLHSTDSIKFKAKYANILFTRQSNGLTSIYHNGVIQGIPTTTGVPVSGATSLLIGNNPSITRGLLANLAQLQIFQGIMSQNEISQKFTSERSKYNV
jgi:hypothetical protein